MTPGEYGALYYAFVAHVQLLARLRRVSYWRLAAWSSPGRALVVWWFQLFASSIYAPPIGSLLAEFRSQLDLKRLPSLIHRMARSVEASWARDWPLPQPEGPVPSPSRRVCRPLLLNSRLDGSVVLLANVVLPQRPPQDERQIPRLKTNFWIANIKYEFIKYQITN